MTHTITLPSGQVFLLPIDQLSKPKMRMDKAAQEVINTAFSQPIPPLFSEVCYALKEGEEKLKEQIAKGTLTEDEGWESMIKLFKRANAEH